MPYFYLLSYTLSTKLLLYSQPWETELNLKFRSPYFQICMWECFLCKAAEVLWRQKTSMVRQPWNSIRLYKHPAWRAFNWQKSTLTNRKREDFSLEFSNFRFYAKMSLGNYILRFYKGQPNKFWIAVPKGLESCHKIV